MIGFNHMTGNIGFFLFTSVGGLLYDNWRKDGPFIVAGALLLLAVLLVKVIHQKKIAPVKPMETLD